MKQTVEKRKASGIIDYFALALTTFGVGYIPGAPGTYGSAVAVAIYLGVVSIEEQGWHGVGIPFHWALNSVALMAFCLVGVWASNRAIPLLGNEDPSEAVVDEVMGQLLTFCFIPFGVGWPFILAGFLLFRAFDIWKPYPVKAFEDLRGGLGICADDIVAGVYAGVCVAIGYAIFTLI